MYRRYEFYFGIDTMNELILINNFMGWIDREMVQWRHINIYIYITFKLGWLTVERGKLNWSFWAKRSLMRFDTRKKYRNIN